MKRRFACFMAFALCTILIFGQQDFAFSSEYAKYANPINVPNGYDWAHNREYDNEAKSYFEHDIWAPYETPVYAIQDGSISCEQIVGTGGTTYKGIDCKDKLVSYGNIIYFTSKDGKTTARYAHLNRFEKFDIKISESAGYGSSTTRYIYDHKATGAYHEPCGSCSVKKGDVIGYVGTTGNSSGYHLHFELRINGKRVSPDNYIGIKGDIIKPTINSVPGTRVIAGKYYNEKCTASGTNITWSISNGKLPYGLSIDSSTGEIKGTLAHTVNGKFNFQPTRYSFTVKASNSAGTSTKSSSITVWEPPVIGVSSLANGKVGSSYNQTIPAQGTEFSMNWRLKSGSLPPGLKLNSSSSTRTATISGTPTRAGNYTFTIQLYNLVGNPETTTTKRFTITVLYNSYTPSVRDTSITTSGTFAIGTVGKSYSSYISVNNVTRGKFSVVSTFTKPDGLEFTTSGKLIYLKGIPTKAGNYKFSIRITREDGHFNEIGPFSMSVYSRNSSTYTVNLSNAEELDEFSSENAFTPLYLVSEENENEEGPVTVEAGQPLEFKIGDWIDESGFYVVDELSDIEVLINDEVSEHATILDNNSFLIESEAVKGEFTVCARAFVGDTELRTKEINVITDTTETSNDISDVITADTASENTQGSSNTGGCNVTLAGTILLALCGTMIFRKSN